MTLFMKIAAAAALLCPAMFHASAETNYPDLYIRGNFTNWEPRSEYQMTRVGNQYSITLDQLDGEFKIGDGADWHIYNLGSSTGSKYQITASESLTAMVGGANFKASNLSDVKISFAYTEGSNTATVDFIIGDKPAGVKGLSGTLPVLYIEVRDASGNYDNEVISKDLDHKNYFSGSYWLDLNGCQWLADLGATSIGSAEAPLPLEIKARGNWTRKGFSKKPFKLKLGKKQAMLGLTKSKHFAILAHADDNKGYLRNFTGFNLGRRIGLPWTPEQQPIELVINGDYRGLYFLTESIRVGDDRIMIEELADNLSDPSLISGGYVVELDNYDEENQIRMTEKGAVDGYKDKLRITFDTPEIYSDLQRRFVSDQFTAMNDLVGANSDDLWRYLDLDDAARYYLVEEIISHVEAFHGSTYLFRDRGENQKWHFSPIWDCGNAFNGPTDGFFYRHAPFGATWIPTLRINEMFNDKVRQTWLWFMQRRFDGLYDDMERYASCIAEAAKADRRRWRDQPVPSGGNSVQDNSDMAGKLNEVKNHLKAKISWLKGKFGDYTTGTYTEPARDQTPAMPLPDYASAIEEMGFENDSKPIYFNLQGIQIANPRPGEICIVRCGTKSKKVIF